MQYITLSEVSDHILINTNLSNAYVVTYSYSKFLLTLVNFAKTNDGPIFRVMRETLECGLVAYQVPASSSFRPIINEIIQTIRESGLYKKYEEWSMMYLRSVYKPLRYAESERSRPVTWSGINCVFYGYLIGVALATVVFVAERVWHWAVRLRVPRNMASLQ